MTGRGRALRRTVLLVTLAAALGVAGGGAAWVLVRLIGILTNVALSHRWGTDLPSFSDYHPDWTLLVAAAAGGVVVALFARWAPVIRDTGSRRRWRRCSPARAGSHREPRWQSRSPLRSPLVPADRSGRRVRSSLPAARSGRSSGRWFGCPRPSARSCWRRVRRPAWPPFSAPRSRPWCSPSSCCSSNSRPAH